MIWIFVPYLLITLKLLSCYNIYWIPGKHDIELSLYVGLLLQKWKSVSRLYYCICFCWKHVVEQSLQKRCLKRNYGPVLKDLLHWIWWKCEFCCFLHKTNCSRVENFSGSENGQIKLKRTTEMTRSLFHFNLSVKHVWWKMNNEMKYLRREGRYQISCHEMFYRVQFRLWTVPYSVGHRMTSAEYLSTSWGQPFQLSPSEWENYSH